MNRRYIFVAIAGLWLFARPVAAQLQLFPTAKAKAAAVEKPFDQAKEDAKTLSDAKLSGEDSAALIAYFQERTLSEANLAKILAVIKRMGDEDFEGRVKASAEAEAFGPAAIGPLRTAALTDADPEIQFRALETLRRIEKSVSHGMVAAAAGRALAKLQSPDAAAAIIGFLPMADNASVDDDLRTVLKSPAFTKDDALEPALVKALQDANAIRRSGAAVALIEASFEKKKRQDDVAKLVVPMLKSETDNEAKFRVAFVLGTTGKNADAVKALVETLPSLPRGRIWQVEDILLQLAGATPPKIKLGPSTAAIEKGRDEWLAWLAANAKPMTYEQFAFKPRTNGRLQVLSMDQNWNGGRITEHGADLKLRWKISGISTPADFQMLPNGNIEIMEHNYSRITERDIRGNIKVNKPLPNGGPPMSVQRLDNGNLLIAYRQSVIEYDAAMKVLGTWARNNQDVLYAAKYGNGSIVALVSNPPNLIRLDDKYKELPNPIKIGPPYYQAKMEMLPDDRVLITEQDKVAEYSLKDGKQLWKFATQNPTCVQRLPSGNTMVVDMQNRTVKEVAEDGTVVWTYTPPDSLQPMRAYRQ